jgi:hypothetical protein
MVLQEPKMPEANVTKFLVGADGENIDEHPERKEYMAQVAKNQRMQQGSVCGVM